MAPKPRPPPSCVFSCAQCGAKFASLQALGGHKSVHSGKKRTRQDAAGSRGTESSAERAAQRPRVQGASSSRLAPSSSPGFAAALSGLLPRWESAPQQPPLLWPPGLVSHDALWYPGPHIPASHMATPPFFATSSWPALTSSTAIFPLPPAQPLLSHNLLETAAMKLRLLASASASPPQLAPADIATSLSQPGATSAYLLRQPVRLARSESSTSTSLPQAVLAAPASDRAAPADVTPRFTPRPSCQLSNALASNASLASEELSAPPLELLGERLSSQSEGSSGFPPHVSQWAARAALHPPEGPRARSANLEAPQQGATERPVCPRRPGLEGGAALALEQQQLLQLRQKLGGWGEGRGPSAWRMWAPEEVPEAVAPLSLLKKAHSEHDLDLTLRL